MKKILIVSVAQSQENVDLLHSFVANINNLGDGKYICNSVHYSELEYIFDEQKNDVKVISSNLSVLDYDFVYFKSFIGYIEHAVALAHVLKKNNIRFFCSELLTNLTTTKLAQYSVLAVNGAPLPRTVFISRINLDTAFERIERTLKLPFIMKAIDGKGGNANYLINSQDEFHSSRTANPNVEFIFQEYIKNNGDIRVLIVGSEIKLVIQRRRMDESTHLNNTSQGAQAELIEVSSLDESVQRLSLDVARVLGREIAGVDVMFEDQTGKPYILEVNPSPQVGSGAFTDEKLAVYSELFTSL